MPDKKFLEEYPLYRRAKRPDGISLDRISTGFPKPSIDAWCEKCERLHTFTCGTVAPVTRSGFSSDDQLKGGRVVSIAYVCAGCGEFQRAFLVKFADDLSWFSKVGQYPPWDIQVDADLSRLLGAERTLLFRHGLINESQGYGIGAFAYYRGIVESIIDDLLEQIGGLIEKEQVEPKRKAYGDALEQTKQTRVAQEKIDLVRSLLPAELNFNGMNPLGVIHSELSAGIHGRSDPECLDSAEAIRLCLKAIAKRLERLRQESAEAGELNDSIRKILEKKSQRVAQQQTAAASQSTAEKTPEHKPFVPPA